MLGKTGYLRGWDLDKSVFLCQNTYVAQVTYFVRFKTFKKELFMVRKIKKTLKSSSKSSSKNSSKSPSRNGSRPRLTPSQKRVHDFVRSFIRTYHVSPSIREIALGIGVSSPNGVLRHLQTLVEKGYIRRYSEKARSIVLIERRGRKKSYFHEDGTEILFLDPLNLHRAFPGRE